MPFSTRKTLVSASTRLPSRRLMITLCSDKTTVVIPSKEGPSPARLITSPPINPKPEGNVITISPLPGNGLAVVNDTVTRPTALATKEAGSTSVKPRTPGVMMSGLTAVSTSKEVSKLVVVLMI